MSVTVSTSGLIPQPCIAACTVRRIDGTIVPATQVGTYQIDPQTGKSELVFDTLKYLDDAGLPIPGAVRVNPIAATPAPLLPPTRQWFSSPNGAPIYVVGDSFFNADGSPYVGETTGYTPGGGTSITRCCPQLRIEKCWAKYGDTYAPLTRHTTTQEGDNPATVVIYYFEGSQVAVTAPIVDELPAPNYIKVGQSVIGDNASVTPTNLPVCGFGVTFNKPFPTVEHPEPSRVIVGGHEAFIADTETLNSEDPMGTITAPIVETTGRAIADIWYRQRTSPLLATGLDGLTLLMGDAPTQADNFRTQPEFDAPASVEPTAEASYDM